MYALDFTKPYEQCSSSAWNYKLWLSVESPSQTRLHRVMTDSTSKCLEYAEQYDDE